MTTKVWLAVIVAGVLLGTSALAGINTTPSADEKENTERTLAASFSIPEIRVGNEYSVFETEGETAVLRKEGYPMLPYNTEVITFPLGTKIVDITLKTTEIKTMQLDKKIKPAPQPVPLNMENPQVEIREGEIYALDEAYPSEWATWHTGVGLENEEHVLFLSIYSFPVRYIPARNEILYVDEIEVAVDYELPEKPLLQNDVYDLVIIAPAEFSDNLQQLVQHKETNGIQTKLVTLDDIYGSVYFPVQGRDNAEKVKYFIKHAIEEWGITYVMLVGGRDGGIAEPKWWMPVRYTHLADGSDEDSYLSDLYFADVYRYDDGQVGFEDWDSNGNGVYAEWWLTGKDILDLYPDVYVGRLACRNAFEVDTLVEKIISYETTAYGQNWFNRFVGIGGDTFTYDEYYEGILGVEAAGEYLEENGFTTKNLFTSDGTLAGANDIISGISEGSGFLDFEGHGNPMSWATHPPLDDETWIGIDESQFVQLNNENMYPVTMIGGCHNSQFDISLLNLLDLKNLQYTYYHSTWGPECFSWWLARKIDGGAIATIGSTGYGYGTIGDEDEDGIPDTLQYVGGFIDSEFFRVYAQEGKDILGETHGVAITNYLAKFPPMTDKIDVKTVQEWALLGDPSLKIGGYQ